MGDMSSIVSRSPPFSGSVSHKNERRWISMRLGTSTDLFRRAKVRRVRRASTAAKDDSFRGRETGKGGRNCATTEDSTDHPRPQVGQPALTDPTLGDRVCGAASCCCGWLRLSASGWDCTGKKPILGEIGKPATEPFNGAPSVLS